LIFFIALTSFDLIIDCLSACLSLGDKKGEKYWGINFFFWVNYDPCCFIKLVI